MGDGASLMRPYAELHSYAKLPQLSRPETPAQQTAVQMPIKTPINTTIKHIDQSINCVILFKVQLQQCRNRIYSNNVFILHYLQF